jgi:nucleotide-binding universal stress UspA family protein
MAEWKRICCAIDFSDSSHFALSEAADLTRRFDGELTLFHAYELPEAGAGDVLASPPAIFERASRETKDALERWRAEAESIARSRRPSRWATPARSWCASRSKAASTWWSLERTGTRDSSG